MTRGEAQQRFGGSAERLRRHLGLTMTALHALPRNEELPAALQEMAATRPYRADTRVKVAIMNPHWCVDGQPFASAHAVYIEACNLGFAGKQSTITYRLVHGMDTWAELLEFRPRKSSINHEFRRHYSKPKVTPEMAELIAGVEARKAEIRAREIASRSAEE